MRITCISHTHTCCTYNSCISHTHTCCTYNSCISHNNSNTHVTQITPLPYTHIQYTSHTRNTYIPHPTPTPTHSPSLHSQVLRGAGYFQHALFIAKAVHQAQVCLDIYMDDLVQYDEAVEYLQQLPRQQAAVAMQRHGKVHDNYHHIHMHNHHHHHHHMHNHHRY